MWRLGSAATTALVALVCATSVQSPPSVEAGDGIRRVPLTIDLGDFQSPAELTLPAQATGPLPAVVLIHGSSPSDKDATLPDPYNPGVTLSSIFRDISDELTKRGYAVLRYNKHYVNGAGEIDPRYFTQLTLPLLADDAERALDVAQARPEVDPNQVFLYGWSEGSTVAAAVAVRRPDVAGLILQGPVAQPWRSLLHQQLTDVSIPYLRQFAPAGAVTAATLTRAVEGSGGVVAKSVIQLVADPAALREGRFEINPQLDQNGDGAISIDAELIPALPAILDHAFGEGGFLSMYAPDAALPALDQQAPNLTHLPILILQGEEDANVPVGDAVRLFEQLVNLGARDVEIKTYPGLGHSLGSATSPIDDNARPIAPAPLDDLARWLAEHTR
ncbi:MAG: alpha/beta hydrolase family protein [Dehalococcoidia bacterium]